MGACQSSNQRKKNGSSAAMVPSTHWFEPNFILCPLLIRSAMILSRLLESRVGNAANEFASKLSDIITRPAHGSGTASAYLA